MSAPVIRADRLSKVYGRDRGVSDLTFEVGEGEVFGYLGPNGAGKTTTIRLLLDLIRPSSGRIELFGADVRRAGAAARTSLGYLPGDLRLYERLTAREHLRYFASLRGMRDIGDGESLAERLELELDRPVRSLSKGNRQKVGLVQALMHRPELPSSTSLRLASIRSCSRSSTSLSPRRPRTAAPCSSRPTSCPRCSTSPTALP